MARKSRKQNLLAGNETVVSNNVMRIYKVALYARLSVEDSKNPDCDSIETQLELLKDYVKDKPYLEVVGIYIDNGVSGTKFDRLGMVGGK